jgi:uncharacterized protein YbaP (TraB family)
MRKIPLLEMVGISLLVLACFPSRAEAASTSVWKVTDPKGGTLYLGGSFHSLRSNDYPLPAAFDRACDASTRLAFEIDDHQADAFSTSIEKAGKYPKGDELKNHVDPRTYDYLRRVLARTKLPQESISRYRPWFLTLMLDTPGMEAFQSRLGVETYLTRRARAKSKSTTNLESTSEHIGVYSGLNDRESEACLLLSFITLERDGAQALRTLAAWRRGDAETVWRTTIEGYRDFPALGERMLGTRNRAWIPKIEGYLHSRQIYFVVVGAAHMGGPSGVLALLRARGYQIEQL